MSRNRWISCFVLSLTFAQCEGQAQIDTVNASKTTGTETTPLRINDLLDKQRASTSPESSKPANSSPRPTLTNPPPIPGTFDASRLVSPPQVGMYSGNFEPSISEKPMDLVGIYYARDVQKAEIIIGGIAHYFATGDLLRSNWILKGIAPNYIELQRCSEKAKRCEFKTIPFTASVRE